MTKYRMNDGTVIDAYSAAHLISEMCRVSWSTQGTDVTPAEFRKATALRAKDQTGHEVRFDTDKHFVADLIRVGLITEEESDGG